MTPPSFFLCFQPGVLGDVVALQRFQLRLHLLQLLAQVRLGLLVLRQLSFQFTPASANLARLLLGAFPTLGFFG